MDRTRSTVLATLITALVCGPISSLFVIRIACHVRHGQWGLACLWSIALGVVWGVMLLLTAAIIHLKL